MANRYFVMGQVFITDGTCGTDKDGRFTTDQTITADGAGNFTIYMTQGMTGTVTSGTAVVTGSPVTLSAGSNTITVDGAGDCTLDVTVGTAANTNTVNNWSASSGGTGGASVPAGGDTALFDANSFTGASQAVTYNAFTQTANIDFTGATNNPTMVVSARVDLTGYLTLVSGMTASGGNNIRLAGNLTTAGVTIAWNGIYINGNCTLQDDVTITSSGVRGIEHASGTLNTNGKIVNITNASFDEASATARTLTLGSSTVSCTAWTYSGSNLTLNANTSTINCSGDFAGGGLTYNIINLTGATSTITGSNTFAELGLTRAGVQTITVTDGTTQTVTNFSRDNGTDVKTLIGSSTGGWNIAKQGGGFVDLDYLALSYSTATASKFYAGANSTNTVGNTGWIFTEKPTFKLAPASSAKLAIAPASSAKIAVV